MKRCPECRRDYYDDSLLYCLEDGTALVQGSVPSPEGPDTAILGSGDILNESATRQQIEVPDTRTGPSSRRTKNLPLKPIVVVAGLVLIVLGGFISTRYLRADARQISSIAVLPFENSSGDPDAEYLSDGMAETLISSLTTLPELDVKPRSTVFRYKGKAEDPRSIGKELNVQAVLSGRVTERGQDISLFVELIDISQDKVIWSETYNRKQADVVALQAEIARDVSGKIKTKLSGQDVAKVTKTYTADPEAYQLYLRGNFYMAKYNEEGYKRALEYYQQAIDKDPNYPLPYHGIAVAYDFANGWYVTPREAEPKAKAAAQKALQLDETLADTHNLLGKIIFWYDWDWEAAQREWRRANELDPSYPSPYPIYSAAIGKYGEAAKQQEAMLHHFPLDLLLNLDAAGIFLSAGRLDESIAQSRKALEVDPDFWWSHQTLGLAYERKKQYADAIAELEKARRSDENPSSLGYLGYVYAAAGRKADAEKVLVELRDLSTRRYVSPFYVACIYAGLNDKDNAFVWLERAYDEKSPWMPLLKMQTVLDNLRDDPRFKDLLKRMNLSEPRFTAFSSKAALSNRTV